MEKSIKIFLFIMLLITILCIGIGQYVGGYAFFHFAHIDTYYLKIDSLYNYAVAYKNDKAIFKFILLGIAASVVIPLIPILFTALIIYASRERKALHGESRLANDRDLAKTTLFLPPKKRQEQKYPPVLLGKMPTGRFKNEYLRYYGQQFIALAAPTRSGKGVGLVIPNLLTYPDSIVVLDIKLENFRFSAGYRQAMGQEVYLFCPTGFSFDEEDKKEGKLRGHRFNILFYINRNKKFRDEDILNLSKMLYPLNGSDSDMWNNLAASLFIGLVAYMIDLEEAGEEINVTMPQLYRLSAPEGGLANWMKNQIAFYRDKNVLSDTCIYEFNRFLAHSEKTANNVLTNFTAPLAIFNVPSVAAATSGNDFDLREVRKKRMSIYVGMSPNDLVNYSLLVNLFFSVLISENCKDLPEFTPSLKYQCLMIFDEFTAAGKIPIVLKSVGYTAGYNMRYMFIFQSMAQIADEKVYGKEGAETIIDNCGVLLVYPPKKKNDLSEQLTETIGYFTMKSVSKNRTSGKSSSRSEGTSDQKRAVLMTQEIIELGYEEYKGIAINAILVMEKVRPFIMNKIVYFDEADFNDRKEFALANVPEIPLLNYEQKYYDATISNNLTPELVK